MKNRERLKQMRETKSLWHKIKLAEDVLPGTPFDGRIHHLLSAFDYLESGQQDKEQDRFKVRAMAMETMGAFGSDLMRAFKNGNSKLFREWADAVDAWHSHKPTKDNLREALLWMGARVRAGQLPALEMKSILRELPQSGVQVTDTTERLVRRYCRELGVPIKGISGRPKKGTRLGKIGKLKS